MAPGLVVMGVLLGFRFLTRTVVGARRAGGGALAGAVFDVRRWRQIAG